MPATVALFLIVMFTGFFGMIFGIVYLITRQNMAMIEKGMNPKEKFARKSLPQYLKWAMLFIGAGVGLLVAFFIDNYMLRSNVEPEAVYFALLAIGGGLGLLASYRMEKNEFLNRAE
jgi:amino acid transporter